MNKKYFLMFGLIGLCAVTLVAAAILNYYGQINQDVEIIQPIELTGQDCDNNICPSSYYGFSGDTLVSDIYTLTNNANTPRDAVLTTTYNPGIDAGEITTSYWKKLSYTYSANIVGVDVAVTDDEDWLQWTYTYDVAFSHTPKMTVEINYPNGFGITTFDDGSHDGWYYYDTTIAEARFADYTGGTYSDFVETTAVDNILTVRIKKSALGNEFEWHGYANYNGNAVWINAGETGTGYSEPIFEVSMVEEFTEVTLQGGDSLDFFVVNDFMTTGYDGVITTEVLPA